MNPSLTERLRLWRALRQVRPEADDPETEGGRDGEALLGALFASHASFADARLFPGRRVRAPGGRRRREIDLVVLTPETLSVLEIKNWSGELLDRGDAWVHVRRGGAEVRHPDLVADNREKRDLLIEHLRRAGADADFLAHNVSLKILFVNPKLTVAPSIRARPEVVTRDGLEAYLGARRRVGFLKRLIGSAMAFFGAAPRGRPLSSPRFEALAAQLAALPTWDRLHLVGGRVLCGDLIELTAGGERYHRGDLGTVELQVRWRRGPLSGLFLALTGFGALGRMDIPGKGRPTLGAADAVTFHAVGTRERQAVPLAQVDAIALG